MERGCAMGFILVLNTFNCCTGVLISPYPNPTEKLIERSPFFVPRGGHCCRGDLVGRTKPSEFFLSGCRLVVVVCFFPCRAKELSAPRYNHLHCLTGEHWSYLNIAQLSMESVRPVHETSAQHLLLGNHGASVRSRRRAVAQDVEWPMAIHGRRLDWLQSPGSPRAICGSRSSIGPVNIPTMLHTHSSIIRAPSGKAR